MLSVRLKPDITGSKRLFVIKMNTLLKLHRNDLLLSKSSGVTAYFTERRKEAGQSCPIMDRSVN